MLCPAHYIVLLPAASPWQRRQTDCAEFVDRLQALQRPVEANIINGGSPLAKIRKILQEIALK
jgi:hypothetical protein